jgi:hypothetical protein
MGEFLIPGPVVNDIFTNKNNVRRMNREIEGVNWRMFCF